MTRLVDLTYPIEEHFRWQVDRRLLKDFEQGEAFQVTYVGLPVHAFTHIDSPRHIVPGGPTTGDIALEQVVGEAAVLDLTDIAPNTAIDAEMLAAAGPEVQPGDIVLVKTAWDGVCSHRTPDFWTTAPYMTRPACDWLLAQEIKAVAFDFPQDYPIRGLLTGETAPMSDFVTHDVLLRNGIVLIEYLCNTSELEGERTMLAALPLKLPEADGAPARVVAFVE